MLGGWGGHETMGSGPVPRDSDFIGLGVVLSTFSVDTSTPSGS